MKLETGTMTLKELLADFVSIDCLPDIPITGLSLDSRSIKPGNVFIALAGQKEHGLAFAHSAVNNGAIAVLCDRKFDQYCQQILSALITRVICIPIDNLREKLGAIANAFYGEPSSKLFTVGITGTDGKTSVSHFVAQALNDAPHHSVVIGTIGNGFIDDLSRATHTTPDVVQVHKMMAEYQAKGAENVAMEVSSHGLDQERVDAVEFDVAVLTNLGRDHLDYHGSIEAYRNAKQRLFERPEVKSVVLNLDDEFGQLLAARLKGKCDVWAYSIQAAKSGDVDHLVQGELLELHQQGMRIAITTSYGKAEINLGLMGDFNISNVLATLCVMLIKGYDFKKSIKRLQKLTTVPGRMQLFQNKGTPLVVVDYAHTPQALASVLKTLRKHCKGKLHCVFGCGGDRDMGKRPLMAQAAESYSDEVIVTDDNPRTENAQDIVKQIVAGFKNSESIKIIHDRKQAIKTAVIDAQAKDIVLIAGKGHEDYQIIGSNKFPFSDAQVVIECLRKAK
ncbi:MAG TPA: UDP-N-acetylmuramoyl-L-alanyl-D-glutamate--2,6-diaminopimelate ligase [Gammaproteobacteria bacterium]